MIYVSWVRGRVSRFLVILLSILIYLLLLTMDGLRFFPHGVTGSSSLLLTWIRFGFSAFVALMFLAVGALVWLYARSRQVALLLFCFSFTMMVTFTAETAAVSNDPQFIAISGASGSLALVLFSILLLLFPRNYLSLYSQSDTVPEATPLSSRRYYYILLLRGYITVLFLLSIITVSYSFLYNSLSLQLPDWLNNIVNSYYLLALTGILITIICSYRQSSFLRERQQLRLFVSGVILAFAPLLLLTVLPQVLDLPQYVVNSQLSTLTFVVLPLALGYSILRYQLLVFDRYIRRVVAWMAGVVGLAVLGYVVVLFCSLFLSGYVSIIVIAFALVMLGPVVWWLAHVITDRMFFSETLHYRRLIDRPELLGGETFDLDEASELITLAAVNAFETAEVCLFVLNQDTGYYQLSPELDDKDPNDAARRRLMERLLDAVKSSTNGDVRVDAQFPHLENADWLEAREPLLERVGSAKRPLLLSEAVKPENERPTGLARFISMNTSEEVDPLLAAVRSQGKMIGLLVLGERGDHQQYAGPDFEGVHLILSRFSSVLETARLYEQANRHVAILNTFYNSNTMLGKAFSSVEEVAIAYADAAADAVTAGAEVWLCDNNEQELRRVVHAGSGPQLISQDKLMSLKEEDWSACFSVGDSPVSWSGPSSEVPSCLPQTPCFPFAWIPLDTGKEQFGMLALTYSRPHIFSQEEKRLLTMFARQCASAMENAQMTLALRAAYERQKELDRLKDQFIMTASHELRTPLTAVQGYIELLSEYNKTISPEIRAEFIAKARRSCDELVLMVGNILDASRVQVDIEKIRVSPVPLARSVLHILEILEGVTQRENRALYVDISLDIFVMADDLRLRQVLLNLVSNAIKYSEVGTDVHVTVETDDEEVTVNIRDYGLGVPLADQERLFERFVRLERDMNSPTRGAGLGLYISKQLIEAMGGRIWVESSGEPGEGSVFAFTLKRAKVTQKLKEEGSLLERQEVK